MGGFDLPTPGSTREFVDRLRRAGPPADPGAAPTIPGVTIARMVGSGGTAIVYRGHNDAGDAVAVKVLRGDEGLPEECSIRARREVAILSAIDHPNVVRIISSGECRLPGGGGRPYVVMEWVDGGTLEQAVEAGRPEPKAAAAIVRDLARAVEEMHGLGIVHRDIKPSNVLVAVPLREGDPIAPKLADFGLARRDGCDATVTREGTVLGTPGFLAPEQAGIDPGFGAIGPATDVHGLGATLYFLLCGKPPHQGRGVVESLARAAVGAVDWSIPAIARLPRHLRTVVERSLERDPAHRYRSAAELADDLDRFILGRPILARRCGAAVRLWRRLRRHPRLAIVAGGAGVGLAAALLAVVLQAVRMDSAARSVAAAKALARDATARLTDESVQRLLAQGAALDEGSRNLLVEARDAYLRWPVGDDARVDLALRARGLREVARVFGRIDRHGDAKEAFAASRAAHDELERRGLVDPALRAARLDGVMEEYRFLIETRHFADAEPLVAQAIDLSAQPLDPPPGPTLASSLLCDRGFVLGALGRREQSDASFRAAAESAAEACDDFPDDPSVAMDALAVLWNVGICAENAGRRAEQVALCGDLVERSVAAMQRFPDRADDFRQAAIRGLHKLADAEFFSGEPEVSLATARRAAALARESFGAAPGHPSARGAIVESAIRESRAASRIGRAAEAAALVAEAVGHAEAMAAEEPALFFHCKRLAFALRELAINRDRCGSPAEAVAAHARIHALLAPWCESPDLGDTARSWSASSCGEAADVLRRSGDHAGAVEWLEKAVGVAVPARRAAFLVTLADSALAGGDEERARSAALAAVDDPAAGADALRILELVGN